ncbi:NADH-ubiquinone oxidoreductase subunit NDUFA12 family protein [Candidatus Orientia mediorientalis]|uniref:NADH-ubiquinone oxidoreductase subunit NDUFA12 family protein n=1 Tax=Candidatus Orientia mediorientalis TaxID=911112 RepID=UPI000AFFB817|nr:NADH-ubiquinone oxidoreductase subunit NDUFA12 family protein [Candidatus Orientia mediorientalis]
MVKYTSKLVGIDQYGNKYYLFLKKTGFLKHKKRIVIFNGVEDPSSIPCEWYQWLHYMSNHIPSQSSFKKYDWQVNRIPNMTGTEFAYSPLIKNGNNFLRQNVSSDYQSWQPKKYENAI